MLFMKGDLDVIAQLVDRNDLENFDDEAVVQPGEVAVVLRNGRVEEIVTQTKLSSGNGGINSWIRAMLSSISGGDSFAIMFVNTTPIKLGFPVLGTSADYEEIKGKCEVQVQILPENALKLLGLMRSAKAESERRKKKLGLVFKKEVEVDVSVGRVLRKDDLEDHVRLELLSSVIAVQLARYRAADFRGNLEMQKEMETAIAVEMRTTFERWGITLLRVRSTWTDIGYDEMMNYKRRVWQWSENVGAYKDAKLEHMRLEHELAKREIDYEIDLEFYKPIAQMEMERRLLSLKNKRDMEAREAELGIRKLELDAKLTEEREKAKFLDERRRIRQSHDFAARREESAIDRAELDSALKAKHAINEMKIKRLKVPEIGIYDATCAKTNHIIVEKKADAVIANGRAIDDKSEIPDPSKNDNSSVKSEKCECTIGNKNIDEKSANNEGGVSGESNIESTEAIEEFEPDPELVQDKKSEHVAKEMPESKPSCNAHEHREAAIEQEVKLAQSEFSKPKDEGAMTLDGSHPHVPGVGPVTYELPGNVDVAKCDWCFAEQKAGWKYCPICGKKVS